MFFNNKLVTNMDNLLNNKLNIIISYTIKQSFFIEQLLIPYNLYDLKQIIIKLIIEIDNIIDIWSFAKKYLKNILPIITVPNLVLNDKENTIKFNSELSIELFNEFATFTNKTEFINYFDVFMYAHTIYFKILRDITNKFKFHLPVNEIIFEFSDVLKQIKFNNGKYTLLNNRIKFPNIELHYNKQYNNIPNRIKELEIIINSCENIPNPFIGTFNKIKNNFYNEQNFLVHIINNILHTHICCKELDSSIIVILT